MLTYVWVWVRDYKEVNVTKLYSLGRGRVYAEYEMVYGKVYKQKLQQYAITKRIGNGQRMRARTLPVYTRPCFSPPATYKKQGLGTRLGNAPLFTQSPIVRFTCHKLIGPLLKRQTLLYSYSTALRSNELTIAFLYH